MATSLDSPDWDHSYDTTVESPAPTRKKRTDKEAPYGTWDTNYHKKAMAISKDVDNDDVFYHNSKPYRVVRDTKLKEKITKDIHESTHYQDTQDKDKRRKVFETTRNGISFILVKDTIYQLQDESQLQDTLLSYQQGEEDSDDTLKADSAKDSTTSIKKRPENLDLSETEQNQPTTEIRSPVSSVDSMTTCLELADGGDGGTKDTGQPTGTRLKDSNPLATQKRKPLLSPEDKAKMLGDIIPSSSIKRIIPLEDQLNQLRTNVENSINEFLALYTAKSVLYNSSWYISKQRIFQDYVKEALKVGADLTLVYGECKLASRIKALGEDEERMVDAVQRINRKFNKKIQELRQEENSRAHCQNMQEDAGRQANTNVLTEHNLHTLHYPQQQTLQQVTIPAPEVTRQIQEQQQVIANKDAELLELRARLAQLEMTSSRTTEFTEDGSTRHRYVSYGGGPGYQPDTAHWSVPGLDRGQPGPDVGPPRDVARDTINRSQPPGPYYVQDAMNVRNYRGTTLKHKLPKLKVGRDSAEEWKHFRTMFESTMTRERIDVSERIVFLYEAVEDHKLQKVIRHFPYTAEGYLRALEQLEARIGGSTSLKRDKMSELLNFRQKTNTAEGLFGLSDLVNSILADEAYRNEQHKDNILYISTLKLLHTEDQAKYMERYFEDERSLKNLGGFIERLAKNRREQENLRSFSRREEPRQTTHRTRHYANTISKPLKCNVCSGKHMAYVCLKDKPTEEVRQIVKEKHLCFNCLSSRHGQGNCQSKNRCRQCGLKHNTLLCSKPKTEEQSKDDNTVKNYAMNQKRRQVVEPPMGTKFSAFVVPILVTNLKSGITVETLCYHDSGSDETWVSTDLSETLQLETIATSDCTVSTVTNQNKIFKDTPIVKLQASSLDNTRTKVTLTCRVMDTLPQDQNYHQLEAVRERYPYLHQVPLMKSKASEIGICLGRDNLHLLAHEKVIKSKGNGPIAYKFHLGWTICIPTHNPDPDTTYAFFARCRTQRDLETAFSY